MLRGLSCDAVRGIGRDEIALGLDVRADEPRDARAEQRLDQLGAALRVVAVVVRERDVGDVVHESGDRELGVGGMRRLQVRAALQRVRTGRRCRARRTRPRPRASSASSSSTVAGAVTRPLWPRSARAVAPRSRRSAAGGAAPGRRSAGWAAPPATATSVGADPVGPRRRGRRRARRKNATPVGEYTSISVRPVSVAAVQHIETLLVAPDAWVQLTDTQPSGSPAACTATISPSAASSRSSTCGPMSSTAPRSRRQPCANGPPRNAPEMKQPGRRSGSMRAASARKSASAGIEAVREHHERPDAGLVDRVDDRAARRRRRRPAAFPGGGSCRRAPRGRRARVARPGSPRSRPRRTCRTARRDRRTRARCSAAPSSCACARGARPDAGDAGLRPGREHRPGHHAGPRTGADQADSQGLGHGPTLPLRPCLTRSRTT